MGKKGDGSQSNACCHYCRISKFRKRKKSMEYLSCRSCTNSYCQSCVESYLNLDFAATDSDPTWQCRCCLNECCCNSQVCHHDHHHCFTYRRTKKRHLEMATQPRKQIKRKRRRITTFGAFDDGESVTESRDSNEVEMEGDAESDADMVAATPPEVTSWLRLAPVTYNPFKSTLKGIRNSNLKHPHPIFKLEPDAADEDYYQFEYEAPDSEMKGVTYNSSGPLMI
eukprot:TRINITY_DN727_c0_g2_i1.p1 TRINITY_DN727_c0_g2~~TRINITY_DN727_c0_g2_i1.p1  ORF type:complete len:244 (-),score=41.29 TRINITY_DN727_c0_g2_i1:52-726(-)